MILIEYTLNFELDKQKGFKLWICNIYKNNLKSNMVSSKKEKCNAQIILLFPED